MKGLMHYHHATSTWTLDENHGVSNDKIDLATNDPFVGYTKSKLDLLHNGERRKDVERIMSSPTELRDTTIQNSAP